MTSNLNSNSTSAAGARNRAVSLVGAAVHDVEQQRLRILRCTAQAMVSSPGGLRFKAGTRPWLDGLVVGAPGSSGQRGHPAPHAQRPAAH
ncbi:MAG: hypothetical protein ACWA6Y_10380 [Polaromonas sp.]